MKGAFLVPPVLLVVAGLGFIICRATGWSAHARELAISAAIALLAALAAFIPVSLTQRQTASLSQAALGGTVIHMLLMMALGMLVVAAGFAPNHVPFAWWMLTFYWATLAAITAGFVWSIRAASRFANAPRDTQGLGRSQ